MQSLFKPPHIDRVVQLGSAENNPQKATIAVRNSRIKSQNPIVSFTYRTEGPCKALSKAKDSVAAVAVSIAGARFSA